MMTQIEIWISRSVNISSSQEIELFYSKYNVSLLFIYSALGNNEAIERILSVTSKFINDCHGAIENAAPIHVAIALEHRDVVKSLVKAGADVNNICYVYPPLVLSVALNQTYTAQFLMTEEEANLNLRDNLSNSTALIFAIRNQNLLVTQELLKREIVDVNILNVYRQTPFHQLAAFNSGLRFNAWADIGKRLIHCSVDINAKDSIGYSALHYSVIRDSFGWTEFFIDNKADVNIEDNDGNTPLHYSVVRDNVEVTDLLIRERANLNFLNKASEHPLLMKTRILFNEIVESNNNIRNNKTDSAVKIIKTLIEAGASLNQRSITTGKTSLYFMSVAGQKDTVKQLLSHGADPNIVSFYGNTPLTSCYTWGFD